MEACSFFTDREQGIGQRESTVDCNNHVLTETKTALSALCFPFTVFHFFVNMTEYWMLLPLSETLLEAYAVVMV